VIPSTLKSLFRNSLLLLALLSFISAFSQPPDTVVVYEYIYKTDTVWLEPKPTRDTLVIEKLESIGEANLFFDTTNNKASLQFFSSGASATIPINRIILTDNQQNLKSMKKITILGLALFSLAPAINAQPKDQVGFYIKGNVATHEYKKYDDSDKYYHVEYWLPTLGFGVKYEYNLNKTFSTICNIGYLQRGCYQSGWTISYYAYPNAPVEEITISKKTNRFHDITLDILFKMRFRKDNVIRPYFYTGLRGDYNLSKSIEYAIDKSHTLYEGSFWWKSDYWKESGYYGFKKFNYGAVGGFGFDINKIALLEFEINHDLGYLIKNDLLKLRNFMFSVNIGFYLNSFPRHKIVKYE